MELNYNPVVSGSKVETSRMEISDQKKLENEISFPNFDMERENECGICLEPCTKIVLPNCCHAMCINCYRDWYALISELKNNTMFCFLIVLHIQLDLVIAKYGGVCVFRNTRSASCPFCRGNLKRVKSRDLWVLTCDDEVMDADLVVNENLVRFYLYMNDLPKDCPDAVFFMYYEYLM